ncbi:MAG: right-handed parallel beta-helix repeat-containing protein [bacterium]
MIWTRMAACAVLASLLPGTASAEAIYVPDDYPSVVQALDLASAGDTVLVRPGIYTDTSDRIVLECTNLATHRSCGFIRSGVSLIGLGGAEQTVLDVGETGDLITLSTLTITPTGAEAIYLEGITITGGKYGIRAGCSEGPLKMVGCRIVQNGNLPIVFGDIDLTMEDCVIADNGPGEGGAGGVRNGAASDVELRRCTFARNGNGGLQMIGASRVVIDECSFLDHKSGRGVVLQNCPDVAITNSIFSGNVHDNWNTNVSGAAILATLSHVTVESCVFRNDSSYVSHGGAIGTSGQSTHVTVENSTFVGCYATGLGAAFAGAGSVTFQKNVVVDCDGLSAVSSSFETPVTDCCLYWGNAQNFYQGNLLWAPSPTDLFVDPLFCDPATYDFTLESGSPCLPEHSNGCGLIGAYGQGCGTVSVTPLSWGSLKNAYRGGTVR